MPPRVHQGDIAAVGRERRRPRAARRDCLLVEAHLDGDSLADLAIWLRLRFGAHHRIGEVTVDLADVLFLARCKYAAVTEDGGAEEQQQIQSGPAEQAPQRDAGERVALRDA